MKNILALILVLLLTLTLGCGKGTVETQAGQQTGDPDQPASTAAGAEAETGVIRHLPSFPVDIMPLYEAVDVISCQFSVRHSTNYVIGKDFHYISFESDADRDEISEYYRELLDEIDEEWSIDEYSFDGYIDGRRVSIGIPDWEYDNSLGVPVTISIGEDPSHYADYNRYYDTYPDDLIEIYAADTDPEYQYTEYYRSQYVRYFTTYFTHADPENVLDFFRETYGDKDNFTETEDEYAVRFHWNDGDYRCTVNYQLQASFMGNGVGFTVDKDLDLDEWEMR